MSLASAVEPDSSPGKPAATPLCVELDLALLRTDLLYESLALLARQDPLALLRMPLWAAQGKARLKREVARRVAVDYASLPLNEELVDWLREQRAQGRRLMLVSDSDQILVDGIARRLDLFEAARGSDGVVNQHGERKRDLIREEVGERYAYAGDPGKERPVLDAAAGIVPVGAVDGLMRRRPDAPVEAAFPAATPRLALWAKALRVHQWSKNALAFLPALLAGPLASWEDYGAAALTFLMLSCLASAGYLINDLLDLEADRRHATKRFRPFAAARLPVRDGLLAAPLLITAAAAIGLALPFHAAVIGTLYLLTTLLYSLVLKREPILDVMVLACLFTIRLAAGAVAIVEPLSFWLLTFSVFVFMSLAVVKRYAELNAVEQSGGSEISSRGYTVTDLPLLLALGVGTGMAACVIFVIYLIQEAFPKDVYGRPGWLWLAFPLLLYWVARVWRLAVHGQMNEDPVLFALKDRVSWMLGAALVLILLVAW